MKEPQRPDLNKTTLDKVQQHVHKSKSHGIPVKPAFRHVIEIDWFRQFTWKERMQILLGYQLQVMIRIPTLHKPGVFDRFIKSVVTEETTPHADMAARMRLDLAKTMPQGYEVQKEAK
jgi:hypothetical protein